jgi:hypothetical protein
VRRIRLRDVGVRDRGRIFELEDGQRIKDKE